MEPEILKLLDADFDTVETKKQILNSYRECQSRGLLHSTKFFAELLVCLQKVQIPNDELFTAGEFDKRYLRCFAYFSKKEYDRAEYFAQKATTPKTKFLYYYAKYQSSATKGADAFGETIGSLVESRSKEARLKNLYWELRNDLELAKDGYCLYLYGVVQRIMGLHALALKTLEAALKLEPYLWAAWIELSVMTKTKNEIFALHVPYSWITLMFLGVSLTVVDPSLPIVQLIWSKLDKLFPGSLFVSSQRAVAFNAKYPQEVEEAQKAFEKVRKSDPCRLDNLDTYSNMLYVKEDQRQLALLAQEMQAVDAHRSETCGVIGNVYSFRGQHAQALLYFKKAIKINVNYFPAWTFMGHEYASIKNYHAAIHCYNQAIEVNKLDHRAWFSLSMMYDQLKMLYYALYYQQRAQRLRPNCPRMMLSLAERYEKLLKHDDAAVCYTKTYSFAKNSGAKEASIALFKLAKLYTTLRETEKAKNTYSVYAKYVWNMERRNNADLLTALMFLCDYYVPRDMIGAQPYLRMLEELPEAQEDLRGIREKFRGDLPAAGSADESVNMADVSDTSMVLDTST